MNYFLRSSALCAALIGGISPAVSADQYWDYTYHGIEVIAPGRSPDFTQNIAHNLYRLDQAFLAVLKTNPDKWRDPTTVYALRQDSLDLITGKKGDTTTRSFITPFHNTVLTAADDTRENRYWSLYFSYGTGLLASAYSFRYPQWFTTGLAEVLAASAITSKNVVVGAESSGRVFTLQRQAFIPLRTFLALRWNDPQFATAEFQELYAAEAWYLTHQIMIEQWNHASFYQYFVHLDNGDSEDKAFSASFDQSYESLDQALQKVFAAHKISIIKVTVPDQDDGTEPQRLSDTDALGKLALLTAERGVQPKNAMPIASQALALDDSNPEALEAKLQSQLRSSDFVAARQGADALCDATTPAKLLRVCARTYDTLFFNDKAATDAARTLALKSRDFFEKTVKANPNDVEAWYSLAKLVMRLRDVEYAKTLVPQEQAIQAQYPRLGALAEPLSQLCFMIGNAQDGMRYALMWQKNAMSASDRQNASNYVEQVKNLMEQRKALQGSAPGQ